MGIMPEIEAKVAVVVGATARTMAGKEGAPGQEAVVADGTKVRLNWEAPHVWITWMFCLCVHSQRFQLLPIRNVPTSSPDAWVTRLTRLSWLYHCQLKAHMHAVVSLCTASL